MLDPRNNLLLMTDSYKFSHAPQYPNGISEVLSYLESRGGRTSSIIWFGLQYILKRYLEGDVVSLQDITEAEAFIKPHLMGRDDVFNRAMWTHILEKHGGKLPIEIKAVPEGMSVPTSNVLMTVRNTDPLCFPLTNILETLLAQVWYPSTVCTQSQRIRDSIKNFLEITADDNSGLEFKLHDFGFRGSTSPESAGIGGMAHLVNFQGTDTVNGVEYARRYYNAEMPGVSIPAAEHSTICAWGEDGEKAAYENMLDTYPKGLVAVVSDSYNIFKACEEIWGTELKEKVLAREGTLVVRPDSGDIVPTVRRVIEILMAKFGSEQNTKGYKVLNPKVRVIQGDGVDGESIEAVLSDLQMHKISADNIGFGMGGGLLQKLHRDTHEFAFKCCNVVVNGEDRPVWKHPVTSTAKISKRGRLALIMGDTGLRTVQTNVGEDQEMEGEDILQTVFLNGDLTMDQSFDDIRLRARNADSDSPYTMTAKQLAAHDKELEDAAKEKQERASGEKWLSEK